MLYDASSQPHRGRVPLGLIGMIILVISVESYLAGRSADFTLDVATTWRWSDLSARLDAPAAQVLCFGDSLVKFGVAPRLVQARSGRTACNLAVFQGTPPTSYILLRRALEAGARPAALVIDGEMLSKDPLEHPEHWPELASPNEAAGLAWTARDAHFLTSYALSWALHSVRSRQEIRTNFRAALRGEAIHTGDYFALNWRNWRANQGAFIIPATIKAPETNLDGLDTRFAWSNHPVNAVYMTKFLDLALTRGIPVFWLLPPRHPKFEKLCDRPNWSGAYQDYLRQQVQRYPNLIVVDGQKSGYGSSALADFVHLNRRGASAFSLALGDVLRDRLAPRIDQGSRWVELPRFVEQGCGLVEDLDQTRFAIRPKEARRN